MVGVMEFPRKAEYLLDWSAASGQSYVEFLAAKTFDPTLHFAVSADFIPQIGSSDGLARQGYQFVGVINDEFLELSRNEAALELSARQGAAETASALRWAFTQLSIGLPRINDTLKELKENLTNKAQYWAYEQFDRAREEYNRGQYAQALISITHALEGASGHSGFTSEFRFHYLLGRVRLGSWFGDYKNGAANIISPQVAEKAFEDAARLRKLSVTPSAAHINEAVRQTDNGDADTGLLQLWAGRAAYIAGKNDRAINHTKDAIQSLISASPALNAAGHYQYARYLCARGSNADIPTAEDALKKAFHSAPQLIVEAAADPQILARKSVLEKILTDILAEKRKRVGQQAGDLTVTLKRLRTFSHDDTPAEWFLQEESKALQKVQAETAAVTDGGVYDSDEAIRSMTEALPKPGYLFGLFKTRFAKDRLQKWEVLDITRAAKDAVVTLKLCEEEYKTAEAYYREHGGFKRDGGADKFGYTIISLLLSVYMFVAQAQWGGHAIILGGLLLAAALWFFTLFMRVKLGLVEGHEKFRAAQNKLNAARKDAARKDEAAAKAWGDFQRTIDQLAEMRAPF